MSNLNILIIDDSEDFTAGFSRLIESLGHNTSVTSDPEEGKELLTQQDFDLAIIDCFMPTTDGFTLAAELNNISKTEKLKTKFILMSGILIDEASKKEAYSQTYIDDYLVKPISSENLSEVLSRYKGEGSTHTKASLLMNFLDSKLTDSQAFELLKSTKKIQGFELAYILPKMSELGLSYKLEIKDKTTQSTYTVNIDSGFLKSIYSSEYNNSLGELLVGLGYLTREDLSSYINSGDFKISKIPIGKALVGLNLLSPHAVPVALKQQIINRLSDILPLEDLSCTFNHEPPSENNEQSCSLNQYEIKSECRHWVQGLQSQNTPKHFTESLNSILVDSALEGSLSFSEKNPHYKTLKSLIVSKKESYSEPEICLLFSNLIGGHLILSEETGAQSIPEKKSILDAVKNLKFKLKQKNPYFLFGLNSNNVTDQKISKAYQSLARDLHPDKVESLLSSTEFEETQNVFAEVTKSFNLIKTADNRKTFESYKKNKVIQSKLQSNVNLEAAKNLLNKGEYTKALKLLDQKEMHENYPNEFGLYFLWASLKGPLPEKVKTKIGPLLDQEKKNLRDESLYYYVKALASTQENDIESFKKFLILSLESNAQFLPARRDLQMAKKQQQPKSKSWFSFKKSS